MHIEASLDTSVDNLWSALVWPERLARWLGKFEGPLQLGGVFDAMFFASEWQGTGRVEVCEPPNRLLVQMTEAESTNVEVIEVNLKSAAGQTILVVDQRGVPHEQLAAYGAGMQVHVEDLVAYLGGHGRCDAPARWKELFPIYQAKTVDGVQE